jgi:lipopolysaccharide transport system ATP-binding protein
MSEIAIRIAGLSKHYRLGSGPRGQGDFRDTVAAGLRRIRAGLSGVRAQPASDERDLWALRDVSFDVRKGEVVGLIGHNGAGKSTLLKILSRITDPTEGEAWFEGRMGSLLEVGTGFHPELTGRENIYLSGAILGMTKREIEAKADEIIAFSEIGPFIDTPVKRYSSGMFVRLGFAVAAHLEPELLIVDEVLAVGDAGFQRKCMAKMRQVSDAGRTILFVSHNMGSVQALCDRAIVLKHGRLVAEGPPAEAAALYLRSTSGDGHAALAERTDRRGLGRVRAVRMSAHSGGHEAAPGVLFYGETAVLQCDVSGLVADMSCSFTILNDMTQRVCRFSSRVFTANDTIEPGRTFTCAIPDVPLIPGRYHVNLSIFSGRELEDSVDGALVFEVQPGLMDGRPLAREQTGVVIAPRHRWTVPGRGT